MPYAAVNEYGKAMSRLFLGSQLIENKAVRELDAKKSCEEYVKRWQEFYRLEQLRRTEYPKDSMIVAGIRAPDSFKQQMFQAAVMLYCRCEHVEVE